MWQRRHPDEDPLLPGDRRVVVAVTRLARRLAAMQLPAEPYRGRHRAPRPWRSARRTS